ncbi:MAG TPA: dephospho-CoA kinase [Candidatus Limnocylindrales bacterium]|nr:dephospho-CoA kinase [Candidatus Limnocylindrales bacterium]
MTTRGQPFLIGLTGPIGCGKSTVARMLAEVGGTVVDADELARRATEPGRATLAQIRERFGDEVFAADGSMDRAAVAQVVFGDDAALRDLERIIHPEVRRLVEQELEAAAEEDAPFVVIEAIKLIEGGLAERCDQVWIVDCSPQTQRERLVGRGAEASDIDRRLATQGQGLTGRLANLLEQASRPPSAVRIVVTEGPLDETRERVEDALADALEGHP